MMNTAKILARIILTGVAYLLGMGLMGAIAPVLHLPTVKPIPGMSAEYAFTQMLLAGPLLGIGLLPLAASLKGSWIKRCAALALLLYVTLGLNTLLEMKIFTGMLDGNPWLASLMWILPSILAAAVVTYKFGANDGEPSTLRSLSAAGWGWRLVLAWLAFPVIYFFFGMFVAPIVVPYYQSDALVGQFGSVLALHIPPMTVILRTLFLRSATFLLASLPVIVLWTRSRGRLFFALGLAHAMTVGIYQLAQTPIFPMVMRIAHGAEITADSFAYAGVLALLFAQSAKRARHAASPTAAAA